jgi:micrococcal nuclease
MLGIGGGMGLCSDPRPSEEARVFFQLSSRLAGVILESAATTDTAATSLTATVVRVVYGDTIDVMFEDGTPDTVRLLGVDTPETYECNQAYDYGEITDTACLDSWGT